MKKNYINIQIGLRMLVLFIIVGYNIVYNDKYNYFVLSLYLLINTILFFIEGILKSSRNKLYINFLAIVVSIVFMFTNVSFSILLLAILLIEKTKNTMWGNFGALSILGITLGAFIKEDKMYYAICILVAFTSIYRVIIYLLDKIERLEKIDDDNRKKLTSVIKRNRHSEEKSKQSIKLGRLEERNELGRQMHDKIGHVIAGSLMRLEAAKIVLNMNKEKGDEMIDEVIENLRGGMNDIRDIIHKTTPLKEELGINRIKSLLIEKLSGSEIELDVLFKGDLSVVSYAVWNSIENFVIEFSTNSIKYSKCTKVQFKIEILNKIIKFEFNDNGVGSSNIKKGYGINKIEEEVIAMGGKLILDGSNGFSAIILLEKEKEA